MKKWLLLASLIPGMCCAYGNWEYIPSNNCHVERLSVPAGWLVQSTCTSNGNVALTFVPDQGHLWRQ